MSEDSGSPPGWVWMLGAVIIVALILGVLQIIDFLFSVPVLVVAILGIGAYLWWRSNQKTKV